VELTETGLLYTAPTVGEGVLPSVVYRIVEPEVEVEIVTDWGDVYMPAAGVKVGVATVPVIVYAAVETPLSVQPDE
jgi:hypothetical protein